VRPIETSVTKTNALESLVIASFIRGLSVRDAQATLAEALGSCATALARRHRPGSLGRVEVTDRDDMPLGLHDPRAEARRAEAVPGRWRV